VTRLLFIGLGGALGAIARYGLSNWVQRATPGSFPSGTLSVNVAGCLAIGALAAAIEARVAMHPELRYLLGAGFLGGLTTFSAFGLETFLLARDGEYGLALASVAANMLLGLAAVAAGRALVLHILA
jgi:CrcB protein